MNKDNLPPPYNSLVTPHLEYVVHFWSFRLVRDIAKLESAHQRATKMISSLHSKLMMKDSHLQTSLLKNTASECRWIKIAPDWWFRWVAMTQSCDVNKLIPALPIFFHQHSRMKMEQAPTVSDPVQYDLLI